MDAGSRPILTRFPFVDKMAGPVRCTARLSARAQDLEAKVANFFSRVRAA